MTAPPASAEESTRRAATRARLLDAAYDVFAEVGLAAATVEQISERAGFTRGAFYSNFSSKEQLFLALTERVTDAQFAALTARMNEIEVGTELDEARLAELLGDVLDLAAADRRWTVITQEFWLAAVRDAELAVDFRALHQRLVASVRAIIDPALVRAGREFTLDADLGSRVVVNTYLDEVRDAVLAGADPTDTSTLRRTLAKVTFAITRPRT